MTGQISFPKKSATRKKFYDIYAWACEDTKVSIGCPGLWGDSRLCGFADLDGKVALREVDVLLLLLLGDDALLVLGESPPESAGLLGAEVEGKVLLALVEDAELRALVDVDDGEDTGDRLADVVAVREKPSEQVPHSFCVFPFPSSFLNAHSVELRLTGAGNLLGAELNELGLELIQLSLELLLVLSPKLGGLDLCGLYFPVSNSS